MQICQPIEGGRLQLVCQNCKFACYGIALVREERPERGLARFEFLNYGLQPHGKGVSYNIDEDDEFFVEYNIGDGEREFLKTTADAIALLVNDLRKARELHAETCEDELVSLISQLANARLDCMRALCRNWNLTSNHAFAGFPGLDPLLDGPESAPASPLR